MCVNGPGEGGTLASYEHLKERPGVPQWCAALSVHQHGHACLVRRGKLKREVAPIRRFGCVAVVQGCSRPDPGDDHGSFRGDRVDRVLLLVGDAKQVTEYLHEHGHRATESSDLDTDDLVFWPVVVLARLVAVVHRALRGNQTASTLHRGVVLAA